MADNYVFLDVDGVLNCTGTKDRINGFVGIEDKKVEILAQILEKTGAKLVLSSSWKHDWEPDYDDCSSLGKYLTDKLGAYGITIVDKTTDKRYDRGYGIRKWLDAHPHNSWIVLDDERFDFAETGVDPRWIRTRFVGKDGGLGEAELHRAIEIMAVPPEEPPYESQKEKAPWDFSHWGRSL